MELKSISSTPTFKKVRPGIIVGLVTGMLFGPLGALIMRFITWGVRDSFLVVYPLTCVSGIFGGLILGPLGGWLGAFIAVRSRQENRVIIYSILSILFFLFIFVVFI